MSKSITLTSAALKIYINNRIFGIATDVSWEADEGRRAIYGLDQITPFELAPSMNKITGTINCVRLRLDGGLEGRGVAVHDPDSLSEKYISILLVDRLTDTVILKIDNAAVTKQSWNAASKGIIRGTFGFEGITWSNEA